MGNLPYHQAQTKAISKKFVIEISCMGLIPKFMQCLTVTNLQHVMFEDLGIVFDDE